MSVATYLRLTASRVADRLIPAARSYSRDVAFQSRIPKLRLGRHVREALANGSPIVALESTVITHGLPEPQNLELALRLEQEIVTMPSAPTISGKYEPQLGSSLDSSDIDNETKRSTYSNMDSGALSPTAAITSSVAASPVTPATIGIVKGQLVVGLSRDEIEFLSRRDLSSPIKASRRDIPVALALGLSAGTTVAATMAIASSLRWPSLGERTPRPPIKVFATGGTGGVHIGGESSMDVSADLHEFARSPVCVVSSGFKSFLDTRRSLEVLESLGCTVVSLSSSSPAPLMPQSPNWGDKTNGAGDDSDTIGRPPDSAPLFPGFFFRDNWQKVKSPLRVAHVEEAAAILFNNLEGPQSIHSAPGGMLLAVPIPREFALDPAEDRELAAAMKVISQIDKRSDLEGREKTPLILAELNRATGGRTLAANVALLQNNARIGARLAMSYASLADGGRNYHRDPSRPAPVSPGSAAAATPPPPSASERAPRDTAPVGGSGGGSRPVVVGCTMIDMHVRTEIDGRFKANPHFSGMTFDGEPHLTLGGVGRNLATAIALLGHRPTFVTSLATDNLGSFAMDEMRKSGFECDDNSASPSLKVNWFADSGTSGNSQSASSCFALVLIDSISGQCEYVIANMRASAAIDRQAIESAERQIRAAPLLVMDANLPADSIRYLIEFCHEVQVPIFLEPTDVATLTRLISCLKSPPRPDCLDALICISPNLIELLEMVRLFEKEGSEHKYIQEPVPDHQALSMDQIQSVAIRLMDKHLPQLKCLLVTLDKRGVLVITRGSKPTDDIRLLGENSAPPSSDRVLQARHYPVPSPINNPVSASGAGDSFAAGFISGLLRDYKLSDCLDLAFKSSKTALNDRDTISRSLRRLSINTRVSGE